MGFKGCSPASSYPQQVSYLVSPPGLSVASYSRVCRSYLCNNLTSLDPFVKLKANTPRSTAFSSHGCPTCVGEHSKGCLPSFVTTDSCPHDASQCYSSTLKFQAGERRETCVSAFSSLRGAGGRRGGWGCGEQAREFQEGRNTVPGAQVFGGRTGVLVCEACLEGGVRHLHLESVPNCSVFLTGLLNTTFLLMGCARGHHKLLADFHHIGSIRVTEVLNVLEKAQIAGVEPSSRGPAWGILSGLLLAFRD